MLGTPLFYSMQRFLNHVKARKSHQGSEEWERKIEEEDKYQS
jgi:hypothetical protein